MGNLPSLDYAVMDNIGMSGAKTEDIISRLDRHYDIGGRSGDYHILLVVNTLWDVNIQNKDRVRKDLTFNLDTIGCNGKWKSSLAEGWPKKINTWYDSQYLKLREAFPANGLAKARKIMQEYAERDANSKKLAVVGFYNLNVSDPRECSTLIAEEDISSKYYCGKQRFATRGVKEIKVGVRVLHADAPTFTVEDYDEAPRKMAKEALDFFLETCKGIFEPKLIHSEFPNIVSKQ